MDVLLQYYHKVCCHSVKSDNFVWYVLALVFATLGEYNRLFQYEQMLSYSY